MNTLHEGIDTMGSFAVNRKQANKGTGLRPGVWFFEEFSFSDALFGTATVEYRCEARKLRHDEIAEGDMSRPYELEISDPSVVELKVFDDDGDEIPLSKQTRDTLNARVLEAFEAIEDDVMSFEMGEL